MLKPPHQSHERTERRSATGFGRPVTKGWSVCKSGHCQKLVCLKPAASRRSDFQVRDGMIVMDCPTTNHQPAHLFYVGDVHGHAYIRVQVLPD